MWDGIFAALSHHENPTDPLVVGHVQVVDLEVERHPPPERRHAADPDYAVRPFQCRSLIAPETRRGSAQLQAGPSGCTLPSVDIKTKLLSQYNRLLILKRNSQLDVNKT